MRAEVNIAKCLSSFFTLVKGMHMNEVILQKHLEKCRTANVAIEVANNDCRKTANSESIEGI